MTWRCPIPLSGAPYDSYDSVAGHALCNSHLLRELIAVTETGTALDRAWAQQAIHALLALIDASGNVCPGQDAAEWFVRLLMSYLSAWA